MSNRPGLGKAIRLTLRAFQRHNASRFGAALAFYIVFSVAPILLITISITGAVVGTDRAEQEVLDRIVRSIGSAPGAAIASMIKDAASREVGWLATIFGVLTLYFGLSGVYRQIDDALRTIWSEKRGAEASPTAVLLVLAVSS